MQMVENDLEYLRQMRNITLKELALYFNVSEMTICRWMKKQQIEKQKYDQIREVIYFLGGV